jgi:RNA polymerase sigma factor (sigma-70 family)
MSVEARVVESAAAGDERAWEELVRRHDRQLRAIAAAYRLAPDDADDAVQTTWLALLQNIGVIRSHDHVGGWLGTTMRRNCLQLVRRRRRERPLDVVEASVEDPRKGVEETLIETDRNRFLWNLIDRLPDRNAQLVRILFSADRPSYTDIASALSMPVGAIGPSRQRALRRIQRLLTRAGCSAHDLLRTS